MNKKQKISNVFTWPLKILFSRFTLALVSVIIQLLIIGLIFSFFQNYVIYFIGGMGVFSLILVIYIINLNMNSEFKTSWIILILSLPTIGGLFYLFCKLEPSVKSLKKRLGSRKMENRKYLEQDAQVLKDLKHLDTKVYQCANYLNHVGHFPAFYGCDVKYFSLGEYFYEDLLVRLNEAKKFIFLEFFIIRNDEMWEKILGILKRKVQAGVEVRVMYDGTCSFTNMPHNYPEVLECLGIKCKQFAPIVPLISTHYNNRDHRKIIVIDGDVGYTGGCNLANEYINMRVRFGHWKDNMVRFSGEAVNSLTTLFLEIWNLDESVDRDCYTNYFCDCKIRKKDGFLIPFGDDPFDNEQIGKQLYMELLNNSYETVDIVTPYFILDGEFLECLIHTAKKGVRIRLILPGIADKKLLNFIAKTYYKELITNGIMIYEYDKGFTHLKMMISDSDKCITGTINLDYRSLYLNLEDGVFFYKVSEIEKMKEDYENIIKESRLITKETLKEISRVKLLLGKILRLFGPLL